MKTHIGKEEIDKEIAKDSTSHFTKACNTKAFNDKICAKLQ